MTHDGAYDDVINALLSLKNYTRRKNSAWCEKIDAVPIISTLTPTLSAIQILLVVVWFRNGRQATKVIGTASNCFTVSHVETIDKPVYIEGDAPENTVAILGSLPIGTAPVFYLNPANEIAPELSEGKFCLIRIGDGRGFLGVVVACLNTKINLISAI